MEEDCAKWGQRHDFRRDYTQSAKPFGARELYGAAEDPLLAEENSAGAEVLGEATEDLRCTQRHDCRRECTITTPSPHIGYQIY